MVDDHADYLLYSFRRFTLQAFEELITMMDNKLYQNRYVIKNAKNVKTGNGEVRYGDGGDTVL